VNRTRRSLLAATVTMVAGCAAQTNTAPAASEREIDQNVDQALQTLYATQPKARALAARAIGILVFPKVTKTESVVYWAPERTHILNCRGNGALRVGGRTVGYYNVAAISQHGLDMDYGGLQAGAHTFSYVLFFMTGPALKYLQSSNGWSISSGPNVLVRDNGGAAASMTSKTLTQDLYAFPFAQQGQMATIGFEGYQTKIMIHREFITDIHESSDV